ncbi:MAG: glutamine--fructose-6-phosphate aminotransferase, partial [Candidatus Margulisbacteria bacterium]|nr:glutamine--fructose-6-phosphate aminotransferase [Candidatus Margulisiibacteriota bacterium]
MCGIFGYIGRKEALPFLIEGLKKLEYRGYDSAGVATINRGKIQLSKCVGKISFLEDKLAQKPLTGKIGIGHTRWATHGQPSDENSHPHQDCKSELAVVHNGIIENYQDLKRELSVRGHKFLSSTDTEVLAHLIEENFDGDLLAAVRKTIGLVRGTYAMAVITKADPKKIVVARSGSPLIIGLGEKELFLSSDIPAMLKYTSRVIYLENGELAEMTMDGVKFFDLKGDEIAKEVALISWDPESAEKGGYAHFMRKEIHEQPNAIRKT